MNVLFTTQVFPPEIHPTAVMVSELAHHLASLGHGVTVAAGLPHHPHGRVFEGYGSRSSIKEQRNGITVRRAWHFTSPAASVTTRAAVMASQALGTTVTSFGSVAADVVINVGPPLAGPILSALVARRFGARLASVIFDLYPDAAIATGKVTNRPAIAVARAAEKLVYRVSDRLIVLSEGFREALMAKGVPESKIEVVPVWLDPAEVKPCPRENAWRAEQGISPETLVVLYAGTIGLVSGAEVVADVAARLKDTPDLLFLFVGEGRAKGDLMKAAQARELRNMKFLPFQPRDRLAEVQATADVSLITLAPGCGRSSVPSKVVAYMAAGRPIVAAVDSDSDTAVAVRSAGAGVVVPPGDPAAVAQAILDLRTSRDRRGQCGSAGRAYFEATHAMPAVTARFTRILEELQPKRSRKARDTW